MKKNFFLLIIAALMACMNASAQSSTDPDMNESTWCRHVNCDDCRGSGVCSHCTQNTSYCFFCGTSKRCKKCQGKGSTRVYKDIAIGSNNWRYSDNSKLRAAEKAMMRLAYKLSGGRSANPDNKFTYTAINGGFKEEFYVDYYGRTYYTYSVYKCPSCHGAKCSKCYNGYVYVNTSYSTFNTTDKTCSSKYVNGTLAEEHSFGGNGSYSSGGSNSSSGRSSSGSSVFPYPCTNCNGTGTVIMPEAYPYFGETEGTWYCSGCRKYLSKGDYHHHNTCRVCHGDGKVDKND